MQRTKRTIVGVAASLLGSLLLHALGIVIPLHSCTVPPPIGRPDVALGELDVDTDTEGPEGPVGADPPPPPPQRPAAPKPAPTPEPARTPEPEPEAALPALPAPPAEAEPPLPPAGAHHAGDPNGLAAQRGRLGAAAACADPIAGSWNSSLYDVGRGQWYVFTLTIHRSGAVLSGTIQSRFWQGPRSKPQPPASCVDTKLYAVVSMPATGVLGDHRVRFGSRSFRVEHLFCGGEIQYTPDRFAGTLDSEKNEFQSIVTDGLNLIDQPLLLRRVSCEAD